MSEKLQGQPQPSYTVMLPCSQEDFGSFVSGLLGKPQTLERYFPGTFEITREDIQNTFHLVNQRVHQQNEATLVQFTVKVIYQDHSSVLLNSLDDFVLYSEVRPLVSTQVHLTWIYLIRFQDKRFPEKEQIELTFGGGMDLGFPLSRLQVIERPLETLGVVRLAVNHTARTWGVDLESLVAGHVATLMKTEPKVARFVYSHSAAIGFWFGVCAFLSAIAGAYVATRRFSGLQLQRAADVVALSPSVVQARQIEFLIEAVAAGTWPRFIFSVIAFVVVALFVSIFLGLWVGASANNKPASFVLLTKQSEERRDSYLERRRKGWRKFALSLITGVISSAIANTLFWLFFPR